MGNFDQCCCCLSKKASALLCTIIMLILTIYQVLNDFITIHTSKIVNAPNNENLTCLKIDVNMTAKWISIIVHFILSICLIQLIFGISKQKFSMMKPFKYYFIIYLIYIAGTGIYGVYFAYERSRKIAKVDIDAELDKYFTKVYGSVDQDSTEYQYYSDYYYRVCESAANVVFGVIVTLFTFLITETIYLFYFITTKNYIDGVEQEDKEVKGFRNIENAS